MTPAHFDRILTSIEKRLLPLENEDEDGKLQSDYLRLNVNPVKAALQIFALLKKIEQNWEKSQLRTSKLTSFLAENTQ